MGNVSVIIPTWNRAKTIERAIRSTLNQTVSPLEVLVCDDGSSDNTEAIVKGIGDSRVKWIEGPRGGRPAIPRNRGIKVSQGEWFAFLDSDDEWRPEKLEKQLTFADKLGCKAVCSNASSYVPEDGIKGNLLTWHKDRITFKDLLQDNQVICSSALIHRSLLKAVIGFPEEPEAKAIEDYTLWLRVATQTDFAFIQEPLVIYTDDPATSVRGSATTGAYGQQKFALKNFLDWAEAQQISNEHIARARNHYYWWINIKKLASYVYMLKKLVLK